MTPTASPPPISRQRPCSLSPLGVDISNTSTKPSYNRFEGLERSDHTLRVRNVSGHCKNNVEVLGGSDGWEGGAWDASRPKHSSTNPHAPISPVDRALTDCYDPTINATTPNHKARTSTQKAKDNAKLDCQVWFFHTGINKYVESLCLIYHGNLDAISITVEAALAQNFGCAQNSIEVHSTIEVGGQPMLRVWNGIGAHGVSWHAEAMLDGSDSQTQD